jgi:hypothetical protein
MAGYAPPWWGRRGRCIHLSHRLGLWCLRPKVYDGYCERHNKTCLLDDQDG